MSTEVTRAEFKCWNDCARVPNSDYPGPCPGHKLELFHYHTSCIVEVKVDGEQRWISDDGTWLELLKTGNEREAHPWGMEK